MRIANIVSLLGLVAIFFIGVAAAHSHRKAAPFIYGFMACYVLPFFVNFFMAMSPLSMETYSITMTVLHILEAVFILCAVLVVYREEVVKRGTDAAE